MVFDINWHVILVNGSLQVMMVYHQIWPLEWESPIFSNFFEGQWTQPFGIVGGTFSDNLSRNSYIQSCTIGVWTGIHYIHYITANILQCHHWFPRKMTSENRVQKFHTVSTQIWVVLWLVENLLPPVRSTTQIWVMLCHQYGIPAFVSGTFLWGNQYRCHKMFWLA